MCLQSWSGEGRLSNEFVIAFGSSVAVRLVLVIDYDIDDIMESALQNRDELISTPINVQGLVILDLQRGKLRRDMERVAGEARPTALLTMLAVSFHRKSRIRMS